MKNRSLVFFFSFLLLAFPQKSILAQSDTPGETPSTAIIVKLKSAPKAITLMSLSNSLTTGTLAGGLPASDYLVVHSNGDVQATVDELQKNVQVEAAFVAPRMKAFVLTNDAYITKQWPLVQMNIASATGVAWNQIPDIGTKTSQVKVAVIDSGIDRTHPDLAGKIADSDWVKCMAVASSNSVNCGVDAAGRDDNGHGTHVAGIIGAVPDNAIGIAGVGAQAKLMSIKVLDAEGNGDLSAAVFAMVWAVDHGAKVINMSLGSVDPLTPDQTAVIQNFVDQVWNKGALIVAAAGNCGLASISGCASNPNGKSYPAASNHVISVGAMGVDNALAIYSQHNDASHGNWVSVAAPGGLCSPSNPDSCVFSTWSRQASQTECAGKLTDAYCFKQGTSMAAPHVAGLAALLFAANPSLTNTQVKQIIESTANHSIGSGGTTNGLIDASAAIHAALGSGVGATNTPIPTTPLPTRVQNCAVKPEKSLGNADNDCYIDAADLRIWMNEFSKSGQGKSSDFSGDGKVDLHDFEILRRNFST